MDLICEKCNSEFDGYRKDARYCYKCLDEKLGEIEKERDEVKAELEIKDRAIEDILNYSLKCNSCFESGDCKNGTDHGSDDCINHHLNKAKEIVCE
jgi:hypothetical protein